MTSTISFLDTTSLIRSLERVVCDYIAGMSDQYSVAKFEEIFVPASWKV